MSFSRKGLAVVLFAVLVPMQGHAFAQAPAVDASMSVVEQLSAIDNILTNGSATPNYAVVKAFADDPWTNRAPTVSELRAGTKALVVGGPQSLAGGGGAFLNQTALITGLTDFIINRAKDEVTISFLLDLRQRVENDDLLKLLFKQTLVVAANLEAQSARQLLGPLRAALTADVREMPQTLLQNDEAIDALATVIKRGLDMPAQMRVDAAATLFKQNRGSINLAVRGVRDLTNGVPPAAALASYAELTPATFPRPAEVRYALIVVGTVAREFRLSPDNLREYLRDPLERSRFLGLVKRDLLLSQRGETAGVQAWATNLQRVEAQASDVLASLESASRMFETLRTALTQDGANRGEAIAEVASSVVQVINAARPFVDVTNANKVWDDFAARLTRINSLQVAVMSRDYIGAIGQFNLVVSDIFKDPLPNSPVRTLPNSVVKTLTFAGTLASADTSDEVTAALEDAALPIMSYRTKRARVAGEPAGWVGLNAYVGAAFGYERASGGTTTANKVGFGGLTVPVGFELSTPVAKTFFTSLSGFFPLIDVGTVATFRLKEDDTEQTPAVTFSQVVAPGGYVVLGFTKNHPFSIGLGGQFVPKLRRAAGASDRLVDMIRWGTFVAVDVPIFRF